MMSLLDMLYTNTVVISFMGVIVVSMLVETKLIQFVVAVVMSLLDMLLNKPLIPIIIILNPTSCCRSCWMNTLQINLLNQASQYH